MAQVVFDLELHKECKGCNTTTDLYAVNCGHMTLCYSCAKVLFLSDALCSQCKVPVKQLYQEFKVTEHKRKRTSRGVKRPPNYMLYMKGLQFPTSLTPNWYPFEIRLPGLKKIPTFQEAQTHLNRGNHPYPFASTRVRQVVNPDGNSKDCIATARKQQKVNPVRGCKECGRDTSLHRTTCGHLSLCLECANVMFLSRAPCPHCLFPVTQLVDEWEEPDGTKKSLYYTLCKGGYRLDDLPVTLNAGVKEGIKPSASIDEPKCSNMNLKPQAMVLAKKGKEAASVKKEVVKRSVEPDINLKNNVVSEMEGAPMKKGVVKRSMANSKPKKSVIKNVPISKLKEVVKRSLLVPYVEKYSEKEVENMSVRVPHSRKEVERISVQAPYTERDVEERSQRVPYLKRKGCLELDLEVKRKATRLACGLSESP